MKFLIIADPFTSLLPLTDSGLALLREALKRGHQCYWALADDLYLNHSELMVNAQEITQCLPSQIPQPGQIKEIQSYTVGKMDGVWIRKDPPFDMSYLNLCWMLCLEEHRVPMINSPRQLIFYHEKNIVFQARSAGFLKTEDLHPTWLGFKSSIAESFTQLPSSDKPWITKPWLGYGGRGVEKWTQLKSALENWKKLTDGGAEKASLLQPYFPAVATTGDRRVFFVNGKMQDHFVRIPKAGSHLSNLAQGGTAKRMPLSKQEEQVIERLERFLQTTGIVLAGVDVLDGRVSEMNITAPTGFAKLKELGGPDLAVPIVDTAEKRRKAI